MKLLAAMSGGVDSAVAAARAVEAGHDVTGVHLALSQAPSTLRTGARGCCTIEDAHDARRAADVLGIPFYVWDLAERFRADVVDDFIAEYEAGRTPNPCLRCNEKIKFSAVLDRAVGLGFDAVVTGHHARLVDGRLFRSVDPGKDQSYVLAVLRPDQLARAVFPLGDSTKVQVRAEAAARGLAVADKPDSHDICFIADGDTRGFLTRQLGEAPGEIVDVDSGAVVGSHQGTFGFTVGQRRGLGLDRGHDGAPRYVLSLAPKTNTVTVGTAERLVVDEVVAVDPVWTTGRAPSSGWTGHVQLRAHGQVSPARLTVDDTTVMAELGRPQQGIAAGQAMVMYDGDEVVGSATITVARRAGTVLSAGAAVSAGPGPAASADPAVSAGPAASASEPHGVRVAG